MHEFDIGSQDARFEIIVRHVVAIPIKRRSIQYGLTTQRQSISDPDTVNDSALLVILTLTISSLIKKATCVVER